MDEVDEIIFYSLRDAKCPLDDSTQSLADFSAAETYLAAAYCVNLMLGANQFPKALPKSVPVKVNVCTKLVAAIKKQGYKDELSYHNFLYPSIDVTRKLLMWLTQSLPSRDMADSGAHSVLRERIAAELGASLDELWAPRFCRTPQQRAKQQARWRTSTTQLRMPPEAPSKAERLYIERYQRALPAQASKPRVTASILHNDAVARAAAAQRDADWAANGIASGLQPDAYLAAKATAVQERMAAALRAAYADTSAQRASLSQVLAGYGDAARDTKFGHHGQFDHEMDVDIDRIENESEEEIARRRTEEIEKLESQVAKMTAACSELENSTAQYEAAMQQLRAIVNEEDQAREPLERQYKVLKKVFDLLPNAQENIEKLKQTSAESGAALLELAGEWEKRRVPLVERMRELVAAQAQVEERYAERLTAIREQRAKMKELVADVRAADAEYAQMGEALKQLPKQARRALYTRRILDLVKQCKKQNVAINDVLMDTRALQKELNTISEKLNRTYGIASELLFADAKKQEAAKAAFRELAAMNESFKKLSLQVEATGRTRNTILALEADSNLLQTKTARLNIEQMESDLKDVTEANEDVKARLQRARLME